MNLSGKKLTTAVLAGLMGATVAGISVVGAAKPVVLDGTTLKVATIKGTKTITNPVNVTNGIIDGTTKAGQGKIVSAGKTVGQNLTALDTAVATNKNDIAANANTLHKVQGDVVDNHTAIQKEISDRQAADDKLKGDMQKNLGIIQGQQDAQDAKIDKNQKDIQTNAGNIQNNTKAIEANSDKLDNHEERIASNEKNIETNAESIKKETNDRIDAVNGLQTNIDEVSGQVDALQKDSATVKEGAALINANKDAIEKVGDHEKRINKEVVDRQYADQILQSQITYNKQAIGTTKDGNYVKASNSVGANLNALDAQVGQNSSNINQLFSDYSSMKTDINKVGARSAALAGLHPLDFDSANKLNFAVASGSFKGENSVALGAFYRPNENIMFSAASTMGDSDNAYTFGLSFKIGPSSAKTKTTSPDAEELYKVVGELQDQLAAQQKEIEQLKADKAK
ncbi:MAG: YadA-like family protein [Megasphaera elsdenii]|nr:YadA-like family protein [Megasphaera elsdenii]